MSVTTLERTNIIKLVVGFMNTVPGAACMADLIASYENNGRSLMALARDLADTTAFTALYPCSQTAREFATSVLTPFGLQNNTKALEAIIAKCEDGVSKGRIVFEWIAALDATSNAAFKTARDVLNRKAAL